MNSAIRRLYRWPVLALLFGAVGFSVLSPLGFTFQKMYFWKAQHTRMTALTYEDPQLTTFHFSKKAFLKVQVNKREIRVHGIMYDLYAVTNLEDSVKVLALADLEESHWLAVHNFQRASEPKDGVVNTPTFVFILYFFDTSKVVFPEQELHSLPTPYTVTRDWFEGGIQVPSPPPRLVFFG